MNKYNMTRENTNQHPVLTNFALWEMYNLPMIVYGELLFIENMIIGGVLLYLTGEICGLHAHKWCLLAGSVMCGAFSLVIFLHAKAPVTILMEICFALAVCTVVFDLKGIPWRHAITFILVTYFMGGMTMGLLLATKHQGIYTAVGIYTGDMKAAVLAIFIALGYATMSQIIKTIRKHKLYSEHTYDVTICCGGNIIEARAFLDTGNHLKEPITGKPVAVASEELWERLQKREPVFIPYETVAAKGLLEGIRVDYMDIGRRRIKGCVIAGGSSTFGFGRSGDASYSQQKYELLLSAEMKGETGLW